VRIYFPSTGTPPGSVVPFSGAWTITADADRRPLLYRPLAKEISLFTDKVVNTPSGSSAVVLARQFVSEPMPPHLINPSQVTGQGVRALESDIGVNAALYFTFRVVTADGTDRCWYYSGGIGTEFDAVTSSTRGWNNGTSVPNIQTRPGDRWVVELGCYLSASTVAGTVTFRWGWNPGIGDFSNSVNNTSDLNTCADLGTAAYNAYSASLSNNNYRTGVKAGDGMSVGERLR
jgi:hypothetical protein